MHCAEKHRRSVRTAAYRTLMSTHYFKSDYWKMWNTWAVRTYSSKWECMGSTWATSKMNILCYIGPLCFTRIFWKGPHHSLINQTNKLSQFSSVRNIGINKEIKVNKVFIVWIVLQQEVFLISYCTITPTNIQYILKRSGVEQEEWLNIYLLQTPFPHPELCRKANGMFLLEIKKKCFLDHINTWHRTDAKYTESM